MVDDIFNPPEYVQRMEIRTGIGERRRFTAEDKGRIVAESFSPNASVSEVARRNGLTPQHLFRWRHEAKAGRLVLPADDAAAFAAVVVDHASVRGLTPHSSGPKIEIEVSGVIIRVCLGVDLRLFADVLRAVRASA
jgi:transposase